MRTLLKVQIPVEAGNRSIQDGTLPKLLGSTLEELKAEAAYFYAEDGKRTALFVFDMKDASQIPPIAESFFLGVNADVTFSPVMSADDLKAGIERASKKF